MKVASQKHKVLPNETGAKALADPGKGGRAPETQPRFKFFSLSHSIFGKTDQIVSCQPHLCGWRHALANARFNG